MGTVYDHALCGVKGGVGWVNEAAVVTRKDDTYLVEGFVGGRFSRVTMEPSQDTVVAAIRAALEKVAVEDPLMGG